GPGEVLVRIASNTICGTDLRIASGAKSKGVRIPVVLGHETAGSVAEVGAGVEGLRVGDRVGMAPSVVCGHCDMCRRGVSNLCRVAQVLGHDLDGGLAEHLLVPASAVTAGNLAVVPAGVPFEQISLAEPLSCVLHAQQLFGVAVDDVVLVIGGGAIGLMHAQLARVAGARTVIVSEPVASRRALATRLGVDVVIDPTVQDLPGVVAELSGGAGADAVVVCIGVPALVDQALSLARFRGRVNLFAGFPKDRFSEVDPNRIHYGELTVTGSSNSTIDDYHAAMRLIQDGKVDVGALVTHTYPLADIAAALQMAGSAEAVKVAVLPGQ
ncbi:MAG: alcohol dehydrogenase catalytic domain-containing protein, partial [Janthinobacterium lividum]